VTVANKNFETASGDTKERKVIASLVLDEAPAKSSRGNGAVKSNGNGASKIESKTLAAIRGVLEDKTSVKAGDLANYVFQGNRKDPDAKAMMNLCFKDAFLSGLDGGQLQ